MDYMRISVADNGLILSYDDPQIRAQNRQENSSWQDPERQRVYATPEALLADLTELLPQLRKKPDDGEDYDDALTEAFKRGEN